MRKKLSLSALTLAVALVAATPALGLQFEVGQQEDNSNQCTAALQFGNTGNLQNQPGFLQYSIDKGAMEDGALEKGEIEFAPETSPQCEQAVQQAAAASSQGFAANRQDGGENKGSPDGEAAKGEGQGEPGGEAAVGEDQGAPGGSKDSQDAGASDSTEGSEGFFQRILSFFGF